MKTIINEYTPICSLLSIAVTDYNNYHDDYIKVMVRDAISLSENMEYRFQANRRMFRYSLYLSKHSMNVVRQMNPERLTRADYQELLNLFSHV